MSNLVFFPSSFSDSGIRKSFVAKGDETLKKIKDQLWSPCVAASTKKLIKIKNHHRFRRQAKKNGANDKKNHKYLITAMIMMGSE